MPKRKAALTTVSVPDSIAPRFLRAQEYVARYFADRVEDPKKSTIAISGERYILVRAASMSVEFVDLVRSLYRDQDPAQARSVANNLLFDLAHTLGKADARAFHARMGVSDPIERLSAGPIHFSFAGWAYVKILPESRPVPNEEYFLIYDHPFSFESDAWVRRGRRSDLPVCIMNAGYSSGWCEESFGLPLVSVEVECIARGDAQCRFIMASPERIEGHLARVLDASHHSLAPSWFRTGAVKVTVPEFFQRKRMEDELRRSNAQLERRVAERTEELARANSALQAEIAERKRAEEERQRLEARMLQAQKLESLGVLAGGIAHDFNNLLVSVLGNVGIALAEVGAEAPVRQTLLSIELAAVRAADLTRQLLAYSGRGRFALERVDISGLVREMSGLLSTVVSKKAALKLHAANDLPPILGDATQVRQIAMNLITNASDALGEAPGTIAIRTGLAVPDRERLTHAFLEQEGVECVFLEVEDTGCGMDEATRTRIFDPFFTTKFTGRGLGLAAALGIVRAHRGAIEVASEPGRGTTVRVWFPPLPSGSAQGVHPGAPDRASRGKGKRGWILVVDDDLAARRVAIRILEDEGFRVLAASDGVEALEIYRGRGKEIDLVLLDLTMPGPGGAEVFREMRRIEPSVRVILMSGYDEADVSRRFPPGAVVSFLHKPYRVDAFMACVREALQART